MMVERKLDNVRSCHGCPERTDACKESCEEFAIRRILHAIALPEIKASMQLSLDLSGIKRADQLRNARKKSQSRRR